MAVSKWSWTTAEINAFANHGEIRTLTRTRWNAFIDKVNEIVDRFNAYMPGSNWIYTAEPDVVYTAKTLPKVGSSYYMGTNKILYASSWNEILRVIYCARYWTRYSTGSGNSYYTELQDMINTATSLYAAGDTIKGRYFYYYLYEGNFLSTYASIGSKLNYAIDIIEDALVRHGKV